MLDIDVAVALVVLDVFVLVADGVDEELLVVLEVFVLVDDDVLVLLVVLEVFVLVDDDVLVLLEMVIVLDEVAVILAHVRGRGQTRGRRRRGRRVACEGWC